MDHHVTTPAGTLFVDDGGRGSAPPIVFLHASAGDGTHFEAQLAHLRPRRRALAIDLRGHGRSSEARDGDYRIESMATDVLGALDALGLERVALAGHSMGGAVAVATAALLPSAIERLVLLDPASDGRDVPREAVEGIIAAMHEEATYLSSIEQYWAPMLAPSTEAVRARVLRGLRTTARPAVRDSLADLFSFDPITPLRAYPGPRHSVITSFNETPSALHAKVPEVRVRKVEGTGHWLHLDRPELVNAILDELLA
jgi:pimeloyl-ACP methyl ester carboxylesterase